MGKKLQTRSSCDRIGFDPTRSKYPIESHKKTPLNLNALHTHTLDTTHTGTHKVTTQKQLAKKKLTNKKQNQIITHAHSHAQTYLTAFTDYNLTTLVLILTTSHTHTHASQKPKVKRQPAANAEKRTEEGQPAHAAT